MAQFYDSISDDLATWIDAQHIFFVGSAPLAADGHVNLSPKGQDAFRVLGPNKVAYLDLTGSGNETSAHLKENGRITFMFCSFEKAPRILRLFGTGQVILPSDEDWTDYNHLFPELPGTRQIVVADIQQVQTSCGMAVPFMDFVDDRDSLNRLWETRGEEAVATYHIERNSKSLDGLPTHFATE